LDPETPPPPVVEIPPPQVEMIRFLPPEIKPDNEVKKEEIPPTQEELEEKKNIGSENQEGDTSLNVMIEDGPKGNQIVEDEGDDQVYAAVEESAEFPGGRAAMVKFITKHFVYPASAARKEIEGKVHVYFEVDKLGKVSNVKIIKGIDKECDEEALRLVKMFPDWKPAKMNGRSVRQKIQIPITFTLNE
jgi:protein TonB